MQSDTVQERNVQLHLVVEESRTDRRRMITQGHELVLRHQQHSYGCILWEMMSREVQHGGTVVRQL